MHFDKAYFYDRKDLKFRKFANNKLQKKDNKLFANSTNIWDAKELTFEFDTIFCKSHNIYHHSNKLCNLLFFLDILDLIKDKKNYKKDNATFEDKLKRKTEEELPL